MKTILLKGHIIKLYDSIDELPIVNFQKYGKCLLLDAGIGSDIDSVDEHIIKIVKYIGTNKEQAISELQNLRQNLHMLVSEISPKYMAFAALIHSIDGKEQKDLSDSRLKEIIDELNYIPHSFLLKVLLELKKKLSAELELYFPANFESAKEKEVYTKLKQLAYFQLLEVAEDIKKTEEIEELNKFLFSLYKPRVFMGKDSEEIKYDKQFETSCMLISQKVGMHAKSMTTLEFYNTLTNIQKQVEAEKKMYSKTKKR